jgi:hypothetical protein
MANNKRAVSKDNRYNIDWDSVALGREPDAVVAARLGVDVGVVKSRRYARGIKEFRDEPRLRGERCVMATSDPERRENGLGPRVRAKKDCT